MRFLVDACTGPSVARWLRSEGHDAFSIYDETPGVSDDVVMAQAVREERILITNDKDFGEKVYREHKPHCGVIFLRLSDERSTQKIKTLHYLLTNYADRLPGRFVVATEKHVRFAPPSLGNPKT